MAIDTQSADFLLGRLTPGTASYNPQLAGQARSLNNQVIGTSAAINTPTPIGDTTNIGQSVLEILKNYQKYGRQQEVAGQQQQIQRIFQTPPNLIGASPQLQSSVRQASVSAIEPTIGGARNLIAEAKSAIADYQQLQATQQAQAQAIIDRASGNSAGLEELMRVEPDIFKQAGSSVKAYESVLTMLKAQEAEELRRFNISQAKSTTTEESAMSPYRAEAVQRMQNSVKDLMKRVAGNTVGYAVVFSGFPNTEARNFANDLKSLQANLAFDALTAMREASKTGGALGQVSERELALLESSVAGLDQGQTPENFIKNLNIINDSINRWLAAANAASGGEAGDNDPLGIR